MKKISCSDYIYSSPKVGNSFDGYKIVLISDLHAADTGSNNSALAAIIKNIKPDIIITAGDMVSDHGKNFAVVINLLERLLQICPVFYGIGNHELKLSAKQKTACNYIKYVKKLRKSGVKFLNNSSLLLKKDEDSIRISGINIDRRYYTKIFCKPSMQAGYMAGILKPCSKERLEILVAHNPDYFEAYAKWGADIVLSGHIHGGHIILPVFGGVISPSFRIFPYYDYGCFAHNNSKLYLTRGLGSHTIPNRLFNPPEIVTVTLSKS